MAFNVKNEVLIRVYVVLAAVVLSAVAIFTQAVKISVVEGEKMAQHGRGTLYQGGADGSRAGQYPDRRWQHVGHLHAVL